MFVIFYKIFLFEIFLNFFFEFKVFLKAIFARIISIFSSTARHLKDNMSVILLHFFMVNREQVFWTFYSFFFVLHFAQK